MCLLTFSGLFFEGFIKRHVGLKRKLSLWSLSVTKAGTPAMRSTLSLILSLIDMLGRYMEFSTETQSRLITAVSKICPKDTKGIIVRLHPHRVTC